MLTRLQRAPSTQKGAEEVRRDENRREQARTGEEARGGTVSERLRLSSTASAWPREPQSYAQFAGSGILAAKHRAWSVYGRPPEDRAPRWSAHSHRAPDEQRRRATGCSTARHRCAAPRVPYRRRAMVRSRPHRSAARQDTGGESGCARRYRVLALLGRCATRAPALRGEPRRRAYHGASRRSGAENRCSAAPPFGARHGRHRGGRRLALYFAGAHCARPGAIPVGRRRACLRRWSSAKKLQGRTPDRYVDRRRVARPLGEEARRSRRCAWRARRA